MDLHGNSQSAEEFIGESICDCLCGLVLQWKTFQPFGELTEKPILKVDDSTLGTMTRGLIILANPTRPVFILALFIFIDRIPGACDLNV